MSRPTKKSEVRQKAEKCYKRSHTIFHKLASLEKFDANDSRLRRSTDLVLEYMKDKAMEARVPSSPKYNPHP